MAHSDLSILSKNVGYEEQSVVDVAKPTRLKAKRTSQLRA